MTGQLKSSARYPAYPWAEARLYRPFVIASLLIGAGAGFPLGAVALVAFSLGTSIGSLTTPLLQVHGALQLLGWAGCFVMGISFHVVPRFRGGASIAFPWPQRSILVLLLGGLALRAIAQPWPALPMRTAALLASGMAICAALACFAVITAQVLRGGTRQRRSVEHWLWLGAGGAVITGAVHLIVMIELARSGDVVASPRWNAAFHAAALYTFILPFAFGVSSRAIAGFLGLRARYERLDRLAWGLLCFGAPMLAVASAAEATPWMLTARLLVAGACVTFIGSARLFERPESRLTAGGYPRHERYVRAAYAWLLIHATLSLVDVLRVVVSGDRAADPMHLLTLGFISMLIIGFAVRVLPLFEGRSLSPRDWRALDAAFWLLCVATLGRLIVAMPVVTRAVPSLILGASALAGLSGVLLAAGVLLTMLLSGHAVPPRRDPESEVTTVACGATGNEIKIPTVDSARGAGAPRLGTFVPSCVTLE